MDSWVDERLLIKIESTKEDEGWMGTMMKTTGWIPEVPPTPQIIPEQNNKVFGLRRHRALKGDKIELVPEACGKSGAFSEMETVDDRGSKTEWFN